MNQRCVSLLYSFTKAPSTELYLSFSFLILAWFIFKVLLCNNCCGSPSVQSSHLRLDCRPQSLNPHLLPGVKSHLWVLESQARPLEQVPSQQSPQRLRYINKQHYFEEMFALHCASSVNGCSSCFYLRISWSISYAPKILLLLTWHGPKCFLTSGMLLLNEHIIHLKAIELKDHTCASISSASHGIQLSYFLRISSLHCWKDFSLLLS